MPQHRQLWRPLAVGLTFARTEIPVTAFNPNDDRTLIERYLGRTLRAPAVLRPESRRIEHEYQVLRAVESLPIPAPRAYGWDNPSSLAADWGPPLRRSSIIQKKLALSGTLCYTMPELKTWWM